MADLQPIAYAAPSVAVPTVNAPVATLPPTATLATPSTGNQPGPVPVKLGNGQTVDANDLPNKDHAWGHMGTVFAIIALVLITFVIIMIFFVNPNSGSNGNTSGASWNVISSSSTSPNFTATGNNIFWNTSSNAVTLTLNPPSNAAGQMFIVDNTQGGGTINIVTPSGVSIAPSTPSPLPVGSSVQFVWVSQTMLHRYWISGPLVSS